MNHVTKIENDWEFQLPARMNIAAFQHRNDLFEIYEHDSLEFDTFDFYFRSAICNEIDDPKIALAIGVELASLFNGASKMATSQPELLAVLNLYGGGQKVHLSLFRESSGPTDSEVAEIFKDSPPSTDSSDETTPATSSVPIDIRSVVKANAMKHLNSDSATKLQWQTLLILEAVTSETIYDLLKYFSAPFSWISLYKIYETLENGYMSEARGRGLQLSVFEKGCSLKERFKFSANKFQVSGVEGRHARDKEQALFSKQPLNLDDSIELWRKTAKDFLEWRISSAGPIV